MVIHPTSNQVAIIKNTRVITRIDDVGGYHENNVVALLALERLRRPYFVGVIPESLTSEMSRFIRSLQHAIIWQHGVSHTSNSSSQYKDEFPNDWSVSKIKNRLWDGQALIKGHLSVTPLGYIPPWNRVSKNALLALEQLGYNYISANGRFPPKGTTLTAYHASVDAIRDYSPVVAPKRPDEVQKEISEALVKTNIVITTLHPILLELKALTGMLDLISSL